MEWPLSNIITIISLGVLSGYRLSTQWNDSL